MGDILPHAKQIYRIMPTVIVTAINFGVPAIIKALVQFESWDFPETNI